MKTLLEIVVIINSRDVCWIVCTIFCDSKLGYHLVKFWSILHLQRIFHIFVHPLRGLVATQTARLNRFRDLPVANPEDLTIAVIAHHNIGPGRLCIFSICSRWQRRLSVKIRGSTKVNDWQNIKFSQLAMDSSWFFIKWLGHYIHDKHLMKKTHNHCPFDSAW